MSKLQNGVIEEFGTKGLDKFLEKNNPNLFHLTLSMLTLSQSKVREKAQELMHEKREDFMKILQNTKLTTDKIDYFTRRNHHGPKYINIIYLDLKEDDEYERVKKAVDYLIKLLLKEEVIASEELKSMNIEYNHKEGTFCTKKLHITLFRCKGLYEDEDFLSVYEKVGDMFKNQELCCNWIDISTRFAYDETKFYQPLYRIPITEEKE